MTVFVLLVFVLCCLCLCVFVVCDYDCTANEFLSRFFIKESTDKIGSGIAGKSTGHVHAIASPQHLSWL